MLDIASHQEAHGSEHPTTCDLKCDHLGKVVSAVTLRGGFMFFPLG